MIRLALTVIREAAGFVLFTALAWLLIVAVAALMGVL